MRELYIQLTSSDSTNFTSQLNSKERQMHPDKNFFSLEIGEKLHRLV